MADSTVSQLLSELSALKGKRHNWNGYWQRVHDLVWTEGGDFETQRSPGETRNQQIFDTTPTRALEKFSAVLEALLTPRSQRFHFLRPSVPDLMQDRETLEYLDTVTNLLFQMRNAPRSGFYDQMTEHYKSLGAYGNGCMYVAPNFNTGKITYRYIHIGRLWIDTNDEGFVDKFFYEFKLPAWAAEQKWRARTPMPAMKAIEGGQPTNEFKFLHVVKPRRFRDMAQLGPGAMPFESWEICCESQEIIPSINPMTGEEVESLGYWSSPYVYSRFSTNPAEKYGRGPAMQVLPDNETLQRMERSSLLGGEQAVTPTMLAQDLDILGDPDQGFDMRPMAVNPGWLDAAGRPKIVPMTNGYDHNVSEDLMGKKQESILDAHFVTLFQILVQTPEMTATEALIRAQEKGQLIAPMVGRQQSELLGPVIEREIDCLTELGLMPEPSRAMLELQGGYEVEYASMATRIQREEEIQGIRATAADVAAMAQMDPTVVETVDWPEAVRFIAENRNVPPHLMRSDREFKDIIDAQSQQQDQVEAAEMLMQVAGNAGR